MVCSPRGTSCPLAHVLLFPSLPPRSQLFHRSYSNKLLLAGRATPGAADSAPSRHRSIMRRDREPTDCDMPGSLNTELWTPLRHPVTTGDGAPLLTDTMLVDPGASNLLMPVSSAACPVPIDQPPRNKRSPKAKNQHKWSKNGHGGHQRREFKNQGWKSSGPHPSEFLCFLTCSASPSCVFTSL